MKTIFDLLDFRDLATLGKYFRARLDWMPFGSGSKSYFFNWMEGHTYDYCKHRKNHELETDPPIAIPFVREHLPLFTAPLKTPFPFFGQQLTHLSTCLVGNFLIDTGRVTIEYEFSGHAEVIESIWALSPARYPHGAINAESILPEYDFLETNTPGHPGEMSSGMILNYAPLRTARTRKEPMSDFTGRKTLVIDVNRSSIATPLNRYPRVKNLPFYLVIWSAVGLHQQGPTEPVLTKIYRIKYEI